jgi:hypothetical protein
MYGCFGTPASDALPLVTAKGGTLTIPARGRTKKAVSESKPAEGGEGGGGGAGGGEGGGEEEEDDGGHLRALAAALKHISASPEYCRTLLDRVVLLTVRACVQPPPYWCASVGGVRRGEVWVCVGRGLKNLCH